jgi:hypothetical protein
MPLTVPLQAVPSQRLQIVLAGQQCDIAVYQREQWVFTDLRSNGVDIFIGVLSRDAVPLNPRSYMGFLGNLVFIDTQGSSDPTYDGLGSRYQLQYLTESENANVGN